MLADRIRMARWGSRKLIDRTTPTVVVDEPYSTEGNGGRKLIRLENGWLVANVNRDSYYCIYVSQDNGLTWYLAYTRVSDSTSPKSCIVAMANNLVGLLIDNINSSGDYNPICLILETRHGSDMLFNKVGGRSFGWERSVDSLSVTTNKEGTELHACWSSKNSTYPNSFNIRYCKGIIGGDGSVAWGSVEQVNVENNTNSNSFTPTIVVVNNLPIIIYYYSIGSWHYIMCMEKSTGSFTRRTVFNPGSGYLQSSPSACVDKDGIIHVAWYGYDKNNIRRKVYYSKSIDSGLSWTTAIVVRGSDTSEYFYPSITTNTKGEIFINMSGGLTNPSSSTLVVSKDSGLTWSIMSYTTISGSGRFIYPSTLDDNRLDFEVPLGIFMASSINPTYPNSVIFIGKWYE